jgi:hypothetical protein
MNLSLHPLVIPDATVAMTAIRAPVGAVKVL